MKFAFIQKAGARRPQSGLRWHTATVWVVTDGGLERIGQYRDQYKWTNHSLRQRLLSDGVIASADELHVVYDIQELIG